jgi:hypothetical protein
MRKNSTVDERVPDLAKEKASILTSILKGKRL